MAQLTNDNTPLPIQAEAPYPSGSVTIPAGNAALTLSIPLGSLLLSGASSAALFDAKAATLVIANIGTGQSITSASLVFSDSVGTQTPSISYALSGVSVGNNGNQAFVVQLSNGLLKNVSLSVSFGTAPTAGSVSVQSTFHATGDPSTTVTLSSPNVNINQVNGATPNLAQESSGNLQTLAGAITSSKMQSNLAQWGGQSAPMANADAQTAANTGLLANGVYNGSTIDRWASDATGKGKVSLYATNSVAGDTGVSCNSAGQIGVTPNINSAAVSKSNPIYIDFAPVQGTNITASATGTNATVTATLSGASGKTTYLTGFVITGLPASALSSADVTVSGVISGSWTMEYAQPTASSGVLVVTCPRPIAASATNTAIAIACAALGASSAKVSIVAFGWQL